jgi:DNA-binding transcriptional ArsR family regulator
MNGGAILARAAALIGDPSRATVLWSLLGGESRPASELAMLANISPQTASNHLKLLIAADFLTVTPMGRSKFFKISAPLVAAALESLAAVANIQKPVDGIARRSAPELVFARTCYDHLAGELSVAIWRRLQERGHIYETGKDVRVTMSGCTFFQDLEIEIEQLQATRRSFAFACLDWSERVPHLGGALGAALLSWLFQSQSVARRKGSRAVRLTGRGLVTLDRVFGIRVAQSGTTIASEPFQRSTSTLLRRTNSSQGINP